MMKRALLLFLLSVVSVFGDPPWPGVKYTEVRAYAWDINRKRSGPVEGVIRDDMSLEDGVLNQDGAKLSAGQVKRLLAAVNGVHVMHPNPGCYNPHNAFVFYGADKKPVAYVEVCFDCMIYSITPDDPVPGVDMIALATIFTELKLPLGDHDLADFKRRFMGWTRMVQLAEENARALKKSAPSAPAPAPGTDNRIPGLEVLDNKDE